MNASRLSVLGQIPTQNTWYTESRATDRFIAGLINCFLWDPNSHHPQYHFTTRVELASQFYAIRPLGWISEKVWVYFIGQSPQIVTINIPEKKEITDSMAYWRSCGQSLDVT